MATDQEWNKKYDLKPSNTMFYSMGPGYTYYCNEHDGNASDNLSIMDLDNGDMILCNSKVWHNK